MQTSNVFHAPRFGAYLKKHMVDNYRLYLMSFLVMAGLMFIIIVLGGKPSSGDIMHPGGSLFYVQFLYLGGITFASRSFMQLGDKAKGIDFLLLPASQFEKFISTLLVTTVGFFLVFHVALTLAMLCGMGVITLRYGSFDGSAFDLFNSNLLTVYQVWLLAHAVVFLGTTYFHKYSLVKTTLAVFLLALTFGIINSFFAKLFFGSSLAHWGATVPFFGLNVLDKTGAPGSSQLMRLPTGLLHVYDMIWRYVLPPVLWTLAYFRLKDKEL